MADQIRTQHLQNFARVIRNKERGLSAFALPLFSV